MRVLLLGGTTEASRLALMLARRRGLFTTLSLAGRTIAPSASPLPTRIGGFGGADGLAAYLLHEGIDAVVDATHPFAAQISLNAAEACGQRGIPLAALSRPAWPMQPGDLWTNVADLGAAVRHLALLPPEAVFLTTGRLGLAAFRAAPRHRYLIRSIDPPAPAVVPPQAQLVLGRGPFAVSDEIALMRAHGITLLVSKNSGGAASAAKLEAARHLGVPVLMIDRPALPERLMLEDPGTVVDWLEAHRPPP